jgi:hypothetical protein
MSTNPERATKAGQLARAVGMHESVPGGSHPARDGTHHTAEGVVAWDTLEDV